jgi:quinol monooxygenase YgiN
VLRHVALFRWKPEATAEDVSKVEAAMHQLPAKIPCILSYGFGCDLAVFGANADLALVADFADQEALATYANHPDHQAVIQNLIRPIMAQREAIQYVIDHSD